MEQRRNYGDNDIVSGVMWRVTNLKEFQKAIARYVELLTPYYSDENTAIKNEISSMKSILVSVKEAISKGQDEQDFQELLLDGRIYGRLHDIIWKYNSWKEQLYREKERTNNVPAAMEGDKKELEKIREILQAPIWGAVTRHKIFVDSFYTTSPTEPSDSMTQQYIHIENLNGQLAGVNKGTMIQKNETKEVIEAIQKLAQIVKGTQINDLYKAQAYDNMRIIQNQAISTIPNKLEMEKAREGLKTLDKFAEIDTFGIEIAPHMHTISQFISNLK
jgi:hypothetical protein